MPFEGELVVLKSGDILHNGRYRIVELVGSGGFGTVYKAVNTGMWASHVAVKASTPQLPPARNQSEQDRQQQFMARARRLFEEEARLLHELRHSNLPRVTDYFDEPGVGQFMVMDFIEGISLADLLEQRGGPLPEAEALHYVRQVGGALHYLHSRQPPIIHRDVKPGNIILTNDNQLFLVDFGIAKVYQGDGMSSRHARGTSAGYSPPEQYDPRVPTTARSDIYALGATLYTLLTYTGRFEDELIEAPARSSQPNATPTPRQRNAMISEQTSQAVMAALRLSVDERPASVLEFLALLPALPYTPAARLRNRDPVPTDIAPSDLTAIHESQTPANPPAVALKPPASANTPALARRHAPAKPISKLPIAGQVWLGRFHIEQSLADNLPRYKAMMAFDQVLQRAVEIWLWRSRRQVNTGMAHKSLSGYAALHHEAIATVVAHGNADGYGWLAVPHMAGGSLADWSPAKVVDAREAGLIVERVALALDFAHSQKVLHRDIHPRHILFDEDGTVYLSFFDPWDFVAYEVRATQMIGSDHHDYRSPESVHRPMEIADDVYSLGGVLFRLLTGESPKGYVAGDTAFHSPTTVNATRLGRRKLPSSVRAVLDRAMAPDPAARYPTAGALADDLRRAATANEANQDLFLAITTALAAQPELLGPLVLALRQAAKHTGGLPVVADALTRMSDRPDLPPPLAQILRLAAARPDIVETVAEFVDGGLLGGVRTNPPPADAPNEQQPSGSTSTLPEPIVDSPSPLPPKQKATSSDKPTAPAPAADSTAPVLRIGSTFKFVYHITAQLEADERSQLFLASDQRLGRDVMIRVWLAASSPAFDKFMGQTQRINHWSVVPTYDYGTRDGHPFAIAPYYPGGSLGERLSAPFSYMTAAQIIYRVAEGLTVLHGHGFFHGRLDPRSILFDEHDQAWVSLHHVDLTQGIPSSGIVRYVKSVTPYISPEQLSTASQRVDWRADIYALGIILFEMLAGRPPFVSDDPTALAEMHRIAPVPLVNNWRATPVPDGMEAALRVALSKKPEDRFRMAYEFGRALGQWRKAGTEES